MKSVQNLLLDLGRFSELDNDNQAYETALYEGGYIPDAESEYPVGVHEEEGSLSEDESESSTPSRSTSSDTDSLG